MQWQEFIPFIPVWMLVPLKKLQPQGLGVKVRCDVRPRMDSLCVRLHIKQKKKKKNSAEP